MLQQGDQTPHFHVNTLEGHPFSYAIIWQRKNLLLVVLPRHDNESIRDYVRRLSSSELEVDTACVVTRDPVEGLPAPAVLVADRWGEIIFVAARTNIEELPSAAEILDWVEYVRKQCPECEGEAR